MRQALLGAGATGVNGDTSSPRGMLAAGLMARIGSRKGCLDKTGERQGGGPKEMRGERRKGAEGRGGGC